MSDIDPKAAGTKFSQFSKVDGEGIEGVGLKDGQNVRFALTTDSVQVNPNPFRNAKGQFIGTPEELANLKNQRDVNEFLYNAIESIEQGDIELPPGTIVSDTAPADPEEGLCWYDTVRLELFVFAMGAWLPCSPLGARVEQGEIVQAQILSRVEAGEVQQQTLNDAKLGKAEANEVTTSFRIKGTGGTYVSTAGGELALYHVKDPTADTHGVNKGYVDDNFAGLETTNIFKEVQTFQKSAYFQNAIVLNGKNGDTLTEVRGDNEDGTRQLWHKIRGTNRVSWVLYPSQDNSGFKKCMEMEWDAGKNNPVVKLDYLQTPTADGHAATKKYVDDEIAKVNGGGSGPTSRYDGNRFNVSGTSTQQLSNGEVMFLRDGATVTNLATVNFIGLPEDEFDWDSCAKSGVVKVKNGSQLAAYYQVYDITRNEGRNVLLNVALIQMGQAYEVDYESGTPCYFHGVFFA